MLLEWRMDLTLSTVFQALLLAVVFCVTQSKENYINIVDPNLNTLVSEANERFKPANVHFFLYTQHNPETPHEILLGDENSLLDFDPNLPTKVVIHGYFSDYKTTFEQLVKNAYLSIGPYNIICVDWSAYSFEYIYAVIMTSLVGETVGQMVAFLTEQGLPMSHVHVIGHSLGAHVAGYMSKVFGPAVIERITALDPAAPTYGNNLPDSMVEKSDAKFVDAIHTSTRFLGLAKNIGHADFYPCGGQHQPACSFSITNILIGVCDHQQVYLYFAESIKNKNKYIGQKCDSLTDVQANTCTGEVAVMGEGATPSNTGLFYVHI